MLQVVKGGRAGKDAKRGGNRGGEPPIVAGRVPPHDLDAEAAVLSAILLQRDALDHVVERLRPEHFYSDANGRIYEAAQELAALGSPIDIISIASWLRDRERLPQIGGAAYLAQLVDATPAVSHVAAHAAVVYEKWRVRQLIATCQRVAAEGYGDYGPTQEFIDGAEQAIYDLAHAGTGSTGPQMVGAVMKDVFASILAAAERGERLTGTSTGYERLDARLAGLHKGDVLVIAGRPGMGKSAFAQALAMNVCAPQKGPYRGAFIWSGEMPREQYATRMACSEGRVDLGRLRQGFLQPDDWRRLTEASAVLAQMPISIDDTPGIDILTLRAKIRTAQAEWRKAAVDGQAPPELGLVVVDYLQLMTGRGDNREQEIASITRDLKSLAKEFRVPMIALSQLNRAVETRSTKDKRPQLSDLRESGAIEQDADTIIFLYRDEYYFPDTTNAKGIAELIIAKQRNGPTGKVLVRFAASCTRFDNLAVGDYPEVEDE